MITGLEKNLWWGCPLPRNNILAKATLWFSNNKSWTFRPQPQSIYLLISLSISFISYECMTLWNLTLPFIKTFICENCASMCSWNWANPQAWSLWFRWSKAIRPSCKTQTATRKCNASATFIHVRCDIVTQILVMSEAIESNRSRIYPLVWQCCKVSVKFMRTKHGAVDPWPPWPDKWESLQNRLLRSESASAGRHVIGHHAAGIDVIWCCLAHLARGVFGFNMFQNSSTVEV